MYKFRLPILYHAVVLQIFSPCRLSFFIFLTVSFEDLTCSVLMESDFSICSFVDGACWAVVEQRCVPRKRGASNTLGWVLGAGREVGPTAAHAHGGDRTCNKEAVADAVTISYPMYQARAEQESLAVETRADFTKDELGQQ